MQDIWQKLAVEHNNANRKITLYTRDDGKAWFKIDNSWQLKEAETIHSKTAKHDGQKVFEKQLWDWRQNDPMVNSQLQARLSDAVNVIKNLADQSLVISKQNHDTLTKLDYFAEHYMSHAMLIQGVVKNYAQEKKKISEIKKRAGQTKLGKWF